LLGNTLHDKEKLQAEIESHSKTREAFIAKSKEMDEEVKRLREVS
jgi:hypothetical protein